MSWITNVVRMCLTHTTKPFYFTSDCDQRISYMDEPNLGLYVHIPFCRTLCAFCPYCKTTYNKQKAEEYIHALKKEIDLVVSTAQGKKKEVTSLYFGGGSPALLCDEIASIIAHLEKHFIIKEGIGIELHPSDVNVSTLIKLKQAGVSKISIGIQSFQDDYLDLLERKPFVLKTMFEALAQVSFETVSMDFIFALPHQTIDVLIKDIEIAFANGANHIAMYPFIDFTFTNRKFSKVESNDKRKLLYQLCKYCDEKGYRRDSIWTFANDQEAHYSSMTRDQYLGFGCSATTLLKDQFKINTFSLDAYIETIKNDLLSSALTLRFTKYQRMVYYLFWTAYTMHVDEDAFVAQFQTKMPFTYKFALSIARLLGCVKKQDHIYTMTTKGSYYYHYFEHFYTLSYIDQMWNLLGKEAFPKDLIVK